MEEKIFERLERIERYAIIAAKKVLNIEEVAFFTGLSKSWLYKATCRKEIPHYKPNGKLLYFDRGEIEDWMKQNRIATSEEINVEAATYMANNTGANGYKKGARR